MKPSSSEAQNSLTAPIVAEPEDILHVVLMEFLDGFDSLFHLYNSTAVGTMNVDVRWYKVMQDHLLFNP